VALAAGTVMVDCPPSGAAAGCRPATAHLNFVTCDKNDRGHGLEFYKHGINFSKSSTAEDLSIDARILPILCNQDLGNPELLRIWPSMPRRSVRSPKRLGLLYPDGSLTIYPSDIGIEQARREAIDCDENQSEPDLFTRLVSLRVEDIDVLEVPSLKAAQKTRAVRQLRRGRDPVA
jgi:hypothetical protein